MPSKKSIILFYILVISVVITNCLFIAFDNNYIFSIIPIALFLGILILYHDMDKVLIASGFFIPFSVPLSLFGNFEVNLDLPTEAIFITLTILFIFKIIYNNYLDKKFLRHPITITIFIFLAWRFITIFTSTMPLVSLKYFIMLLWFIIPFYFIFIEIAKNRKKANKFFILYIISFSLLIIYFIILHSQSFFSLRAAATLQHPFFKDHTSYGAALALFIPLIIGFIFDKEHKKYQRIIAIFLLVLFATGLILSFTRAAWLSLIVALCFAIFLRFKINHKVVAGLIILFTAVILVFLNTIFFNLEGNKKQSSNNLGEHLQSMTNVSSDASNTERINRWKSAIRMFKEKPVFGFGPGTYQFEYAPFQISSEKTIISTNAGTLGNAHSDYLGSLAECGLLGCVSYALIVLFSIIYSIKIYNRLKSKSIKIFLSSVICSLITYFTHGFLNNFLDMDKIAAPFWAMLAIIVAIDLYYEDKEEIAKL